MGASRIVLGMVGSPNRDGLTNQLVSAALEGASRVGAPTELVQMADHVVAPCKDCLPWVCRKKQKCTYEDEAFEFVSHKVLTCGALILGTPVYWWDTSGMMKYFILKMFRVHAISGPLHGVPALGIAIAGGTGNGLISGLRPVYHFFLMLQMRALEPLPVTRFNLKAATDRARELGAKLSEMAKERVPFSSWEERYVYYDSLPYLGLNISDERRLVADLVAEAVPAAKDLDLARGLARAGALTAAGRKVESQLEVTGVYEAGVKILDDE
jgi:multimeric flavodoxin WrbA